MTLFFVSSPSVVLFLGILFFSFSKTPMSSASGVTTFASSGGDVVCSVGEIKFKSKIGLGVHMNRAHPVEHHAAVKTERKKARWSPEETHLLAQAERKLMRECAASAHEVNLLLSRQFPNLTLESIKSKRKQAEYRRLLNEMRGSPRGNPRSPPSSAPAAITSSSP